MDEEPSLASMEDDQIFVGEAWDDSDYFDENDPDAVICFQFEESLVEALQTDEEIAACYNTYLDARKRLTDRQTETKIVVFGAVEVARVPLRSRAVESPRVSSAAA